MAPLPAFRPAWNRFSGPFVAGLSSLLFFGALMVVPLLGAFVAFFAPLPLLREESLGRSSFLAWGWVLVVLVGATLASKDKLLLFLAAGYLLVAVWPTVVANAWARRGWSVGRWLAVHTLTGFAFASAFSFAWVGSGDAGEELARRAVDWVQAHQQAAGFWSMGRPDLVAAGAGLAGYLAPALVAVYLMAAGLWLRPRLHFLGLGPAGQPFTRYASEEWLPLGFVAGGLGWALTSGNLRWWAANLLLTVIALYFVHGAAIILSYLGPSLGGNRWVRAAVVVLGAQVPLAFLYAALGLLDSFVKLRREDDNEGSWA